MHKKKTSLIPLISSGEFDSNDPTAVNSSAFNHVLPAAELQAAGTPKKLTRRSAQQQSPCECLSVVSVPSREASGQLKLNGQTGSVHMMNESLSRGDSRLLNMPPGQMSTSGSGGITCPLPKSVAMSVDGHRATVTLTSESIRISYKNSKRCCLVGKEGEEVLLNDVLSSELIGSRTARYVWYPFSEKVYGMYVYTFSRSQRNPSMWLPRRIQLTSPNERVVESCCSAINCFVKEIEKRPKYVLVFINPYGGRRRATHVYDHIVAPVFQRAGMKASVMTTKFGGDAKETLMHLTRNEVASLDGVLAVGGDGLFHEIVNALLLMRSKNDECANLANAIKVGHIPAGSTDAVACTLNGTRSAFSASMRVALGDGVPLDVVRIDSVDGTTEFAVSMASYGFMGDLMAESERMRWMGPIRYEVVGARMLAANRSYEARIEYLPAPEDHPGRISRVCTKDCIVCSQKSHSRLSKSQKSFSFHADESLKRLPEEWKVVEGSFAGIMLVVMPCRSQKSSKGVARYGHLSDGNIHLVMVKRCSRFQYLRFLMRLSNSGLEAGSLNSYVEVVHAVAVKITEIGENRSTWNIDGELLKTPGITAETHKGVIQVFARGVEGT